ncbi:hypothetical protein HGA64_01990 [Candidatus Falkowbacteria bacterium]|nr:hypothetical protein [Candidatus Falkowbacteria bacterium]
MIWNKLKNNQSGMILMTALVITGLFLVMASGLSGISFLQTKLYKQQLAKHQALHLAEAGINYYRWHLAHSQNDFMDGTGTDPGGGGAPYGPYTHNYASPDGSITGKYELTITPPAVGSTIVGIKAVGWLDSYPNIKRGITVRYGIPSLAHYSILANSDVWFGNSEKVSGEMHSNGGIRMDGSNDSLVTSARSTWTCTSNFGCSGSSSCHAPCTWASSKCTCPGVFGAGTSSSLWTSPVTTVDYNALTANISAIKTSAQSSGVYLTVNGSNKGYHIIFKNNGHFDARLVSAVNNGISQLDDNWSSYVNTSESIRTEGSATDYAIPANGLIFVNDGDVWVEGVVKGRATLVAATLPENSSKYRTIFINNNLTYFARDGSNILGLIAQKDVKVPKHAPNTLTIDAVMLSQYGRVFYNNYSSHSVKTKIEVYGGILTNKTWTWTWVSGSSTLDGYDDTALIYDPLATFAPPPSFPTTGQYTLVSWDEK